MCQLMQDTCSTFIIIAHCRCISWSVQWNKKPAYIINSLTTWYVYSSFILPFCQLNFFVCLIIVEDNRRLYIHDKLFLQPVVDSIFNQMHVSGQSHIWTKAWRVLISIPTVFSCVFMESVDNYLPRRYLGDMSFRTTAPGGVCIDISP